MFSFVYLFVYFLCYHMMVKLSYIWLVVTSAFNRPLGGHGSFASDIWSPHLTVWKLAIQLKSVCVCFRSDRAHQQ